MITHIFGIPLAIYLAMAICVGFYISVKFFNAMTDSKSDTAELGLFACASFMIFLIGGCLWPLVLVGIIFSKILFKLRKKDSQE